VFLKVLPRFIDIYKQNETSTATTQRGTLRGPLYNTVRTFTAEDCLGNPPTSPERRACETTSHQPAAASQQQPASCSQPAKPASQASQPMLHPGIEASGLQASMAPNSYIGASNRFPQPATGRHRLPQVATGRQTFWHPRHQGGSQTCHKPIKYRRYGLTCHKPHRFFRK
jgi:hypothetical protein